jgi:hypothetical protein
VWGVTWMASHHKTHSVGELLLGAKKSLTYDGVAFDSWPLSSGRVWRWHVNWSSQRRLASDLQYNSHSLHILQNNHLILKIKTPSYAYMLAC